MKDLAQQEFRGNLTTEKARAMNALFLADRASGLWRPASLPENAFEICADLARKHGSKVWRAHARQLACRLCSRTQSREILDIRRAASQVGQGRGPENLVKLKQTT